MGSEKEAQIATPEGKGRTVTEKYADVTLRLLEDHGDEFGPLIPEAEKKLRRKLYLRLMILLSAINVMLFVRRTNP
ncbi:transporter PB1C11.03 [Apiospora saccharicola]|uniref:Transporter PB1C11.03 n=1 Tax=Apiospora saccharicola TaxID=335842 RepID=A0ABR1VCT3_9PEZI